MSIGIPDEGEGGVCLERLSQRLCALGTDIVDGETANESRIKVSAGANACVFGGAEAAYSRDLRLLFSLRPSASAFAPSSPMLLLKRLQTSKQTKCQRVLTAGEKV